MTAMDINSHLRELSLILKTELKIEGSVTHGKSHEFFILTGNCGTSWDLRVAKNDFVADLSKRGMEILKYLKQLRPRLQVPAVIHEAERYTVFEYLPGDVLGSWNTQRLDKTLRKQLLGSLADFLFNLWTCPTGPRATRDEADRTPINKSRGCPLLLMVKCK